MRIVCYATLLSAVALLGQQNVHQKEWLALCSRCLNPTVITKTGAGTAKAVAEARITLEAARGWCENFSPGQNAEACAKAQLTEDGGKVYRATADCTAGRLTAVDGNHYTLAGVWPSGIGEGRTRWRRASSGQIVGDDNASGGLGLAQQWEVLCPGPLRVPADEPAATAAGNGAATSACAGESACSEVNAFTAAVGDFRTSTAGSHRLVTATVRFRNKLGRPLILGYVAGSGVVTDDRGNRYTMNESSGLRGLGFIRPNAVDPKFVLAPGQSSDARLEFAWKPSRQDVIGTMFDIEFTVREIKPISASQFRSGLEHPLQFRGLSPTTPAPVEISEAAPPTPVSSSGAAVAVEVVDHCSGRSLCYSAGPFTGEVLQLTSSKEGAAQILRVNLRFRNTSERPLILAYKSGTATAIDNHGHRYSETYRNPVTGMGVVARGSAGTDFRLQPGQSRNVTFQVYRRLGRTLVGTGFTLDLAVEELELLPADQVRTLREYSLNFPELAAANPAAGPAAGQPTQNLGEAAQKLRDLFRKGKK